MGSSSFCREFCALILDAVVLLGLANHQKEVLALVEAVMGEGLNDLAEAPVVRIWRGLLRYR